MKENYSEFTIVSEFKKFIVLLEGEYENCSKKDIYLKDYIYRMCYEVLSDIYLVNLISDKRIGIEKIIAKLKMIDFSIKRSMDKGMMSYRRFIVIGNRLNSIIRMHYGWLKSEKKKFEV